jgi:hypothetical protein
VDFEIFIQEMMDILPEYLPAYNVEEIRTQPIVKNNGVQLTGLMIVLEGENVAPNIYMDHYYSLYREGFTLDEIAAKIAEEYESARERLQLYDETEFAMEKMKDNVYMVLVNYEKNKETLKKCPFLPFLDLAVMFRYVVSEEDNCIASGLVRKQEQEMWGLSTEELYKKAVKNTKKKFPMSLMRLTDRMRELKPDENIPECNLYVMTNHVNSNGSIYMTDRNALDSFAQKLSSNFYIIPSSIHEVILYPDDESLTKEQLTEIVSDVNRYVLSDMEYLSDSVYYYDMEKKVITY